MVLGLNLIPSGVLCTNFKESVHDALTYVLGKFSGDFGQIVWTMRYGHIFASEDNNTSAMACLLHRVLKKFIEFEPNSQDKLKWISLHGLGDGSRVDATIGN